MPDSDPAAWTNQPDGLRSCQLALPNEAERRGPSICGVYRGYQQMTNGRKPHQKYHCWLVLPGPIIFKKKSRQFAFLQVLLTRTF